MENKDYKFGEYKKEHQGPGGPPQAEMAKDLVGTWKKLFVYCRKYMAVFVVAIICASIGTVLTLIGPDKLSDMTDTITSGIAPDTEKFEEIMISVSDNFSINMETVMAEITATVSDGTAMQEKMTEIMMSPDISDEDKLEMQNVFAGMDPNAEQSDMQAQLLSLPDSVLNILFADITVNNSVIPTADQLTLLNLFSTLESEDGAAVQNAMTDIPDTVKTALYTDITIDDTVISGEDQIAMMDSFAEIETENQEAVLEVIDGYEK